MCILDFTFQTGITIVWRMLAKVGFGCELDLADGHKPQSDLLWHRPVAYLCLLPSRSREQCLQQSQAILQRYFEFRNKNGCMIRTSVIVTHESHDSWPKVSKKNNFPYYFTFPTDICENDSPRWEAESPVAQRPLCGDEWGTICKCRGKCGTIWRPAYWAISNKAPQFGLDGNYLNSAFTQSVERSTALGQRRRYMTKISKFTWIKIL